ncbi:MAG: presqualene diphosphate synthase HpnD [Dehalococcoidia bacterium]
MSVANTSLLEAYRYCGALARKRAKNFYYAFLSLPPQKRNAIYAAYAFFRHCDDYADEEMEPEEKVRLLEGCRRKLEQCYSGNPQDLLFTALQDAVQTFNIAQEYFEEVISGVEMDLKVRRYTTFDELYDYCFKVASAVGLVCVDIFGYSHPDAKEHAVDLGIAMQLTNILRDIKEDAGRNRIYIPLDEMKRFGYSEEDLFRGVVNDSFVNLMRFQVQRARDYFHRGAGLLPLLEPRSRTCPAVMGGIYNRILEHIEARGYDVFNGRVDLSTPEKLQLTGKIWLTTMIKGVLSGPR